MTLARRLMMLEPAKVIAANPSYKKIDLVFIQIRGRILPAGK